MKQASYSSLVCFYIGVLCKDIYSVWVLYISNLKLIVMNNGLVRGLITLVIGILLIVMSGSAMELLIRLAGIAFFLPALVSLVSLYVSRKEAQKLPSIAIAVIDVGSMAFGLWLIVYPLTFQNVFVKLMAVLLFVVALHQLYVALRLVKKGGWKMLVVPLVIAAVSAFLFFRTWEAVSAIAVAMGICAVVLALSDIVVAVMSRKASKNEVVPVGDVEIVKDESKGS